MSMMDLTRRYKDIKMAKHQNGKVDKEANKTKTTIHLDSEWMIALNLLATSKSMSMSAFIQSLVSTHLAGLPRKEADAIRAIVSVNTGKSLRLGKEYSHSQAKNDVPDQNSEEVEERREVVDGAVARTNRIADMQNRFTSAADVAIDSLAN